jgi:hypothetical protein
MVNNEYKFVFIHIPKCAGISIESRLPKGLYQNHHLGLNEYINLSGSHLMDYFKFCFVRNPWDRLVSLYFFWKNQTPSSEFYQWDHAQCDFINNNRLSFSDFLHEVSSGSQVFCSREHLRPYKYYINQLDFIGKFEKIQTDFDKVCDLIGIEKQILPHKNKSNHKHYSEYYNNKTINLVANMYKEDIDRLNYDFI